MTIGLTLHLILLCLAYAESFMTCENGFILRRSGLSCRDKEQIVAMHNELRSRVALGHEATQPPAQNMMEMCWDDELAEQAQRWADRCIFAHDKNRFSPRFYIGQNVYKSTISFYSDKIELAPDFDRPINGWYNEVKKYGYIPGVFKFETGHYSQLIWGDTYLVGCGYSSFTRNGTSYSKLYVCNYGPGGNYARLPYEKGYPACSRYGKSSSQRYFGLCVQNQCHKTSCSWPLNF